MGDAIGKKGDPVENARRDGCRIRPCITTAVRFANNPSMKNSAAWLYRLTNPNLLDRQEGQNGYGLFIEEGSAINYSITSLP